MVGAWRSPRHDYVYLADGTWWMGRPDPNGAEPKVTHGQWKIKDHQLCETVYLQEEGLRDNGCEVITMLKISGMSLEEVARATSSSVGSVKQKAHRAYEKLRGLLIQQGFGDQESP